MGPYGRHHGTFLLGTVFAGSKSTDSVNLVVDHLASQCLLLYTHLLVFGGACMQVYVETRHLRYQLSNMAHLVDLVFGFVFETGSCWFSFLFCL